VVGVGDGKRHVGGEKSRKQLLVATIVAGRDILPETALTINQLLHQVPVSLVEEMVILQGIARMHLHRGHASPVEEMVILQGTAQIPRTLRRVPALPVGDKAIVQRIARTMTMGFEAVVEGVLFAEPPRFKETVLRLIRDLLRWTRMTPGNMICMRPRSTFHCADPKRHNNVRLPFLRGPE